VNPGLLEQLQWLKEWLDTEVYERQRRLLPIELLKMQRWVKATGGRQIIAFEGRDAAGKGGTIKRFTEGFCTEAEYQKSLRQAPLFEDLLVEEGFDLVKFWFSVSRGRAGHPLTDPPDRPGPAVEAVPDGPRLVGQVGRLHRGQGGHVLEAMRHVLHRSDYEEKDPDVIGVPDPLIVGRALGGLRDRRGRQRAPLEAAHR
jgi:hypothetical protein